MLKAHEGHSRNSKARLLELPVVLTTHLIRGLFGSKSGRNGFTGDDVPDQSGKCFMVTGARACFLNPESGGIPNGDE